MQRYSLIALIVAIFCSVRDVRGWVSDRSLSRLSTAAIRGQPQHASYQSNHGPSISSWLFCSTRPLAHQTNPSLHSSRSRCMPCYNRTPLLPSSFTFTALYASSDSKESKSPTTSGATTTTYSDDFFGLIFLGSALGLKDAIFGVVFLALSFVAATLSRQPTATSFNVVKLPGMVALAALMLSLALKAVIMPLHILDGVLPSTTLDASLVTLSEVVVCLASFVYTSTLSKKNAQ